MLFTYSALVIKSSGAPQSQNQIGADSKDTIVALFWPKKPFKLGGLVLSSENTIFRKHHFHVVFDLNLLQIKGGNFFQGVVYIQITRWIKSLCVITEA